MTGRLLTAALCFALGLSAAAPARADVLGWLNKRVDNLMQDGDKGKEENAHFDRYLKMLSEPVDTAAPASTPAPTPYQPKITDALRDIIPEGGDRDTTFFYQNVYLLGMLSAQLGFRTPLRVVGHLGEGIDPGIALLERIQADFKKDPSRLTVLRLHKLVERAMAQVQSTHQLMVESRDVLDAARQQVSRTSELTDRLIGEEGRLQSIPAVLGISQTTRKGADNLSAALNTLHSCVTHFRTAFHALKRELANLEAAAATRSWSADQQYLSDRKDHVRALNEALATAIAAMREAGVVVRTDLALIRLNHQALMQVLTTLSASPLARQRQADGGLPGGAEDQVADTERVAGLAFARINPRLAEAVGQLAALGRDMETRRTRLEEWAKGLRAWRPEPIVVDDVPDWAFTESSMPKREKTWNSYSLLPERETEVNGMIETLERDLKIGPTRKEAETVARERKRLDDALGDGEGESASASPLDRALVPRASAPHIEDANLGAVVAPGRTPDLDDEPSPARSGKSEAASRVATPPATPPETPSQTRGYELPTWF